MRMRIAYIQYTNPAAYPPLEHSSRILARAGWQVLFLGAGSRGANALRFPPHPNVTVKLFGVSSPGVRQKFHYLAYCVWVLGWVLAWRPRWVYASDPLSCPVALLLSWIPWLQVVYHEHDSPNTAAVDGGIHRLVLRSRSRLAGRALSCILPNQQRLETFQRLTGSPASCVWNCPTKEEVAAPRRVINSGVVWLLYHGSIVPNRLPVQVLTAVSRLPDSVKLRVIGYETLGSRGYLAALCRKARELRISDRVELVGPVPTRFELLRYARASDIGLSLMPMSPQDINMAAMVGASNKPFDYLACGLALLVSDLPDWRATFVEPGYGLACAAHDPESIAQAIRWFLDHPAEMRAMGERGRRRIIQEWNYEAQFAAVRQNLQVARGRSALEEMFRAAG
jgi:glycosyltransferase involved in cell wall biosynthesis